MGPRWFSLPQRHCTRFDAGQAGEQSPAPELRWERRFNIDWDERVRLDFSDIVRPDVRTPVSSHRRSTPSRR